jgi:hypothetical protein
LRRILQPRALLQIEMAELDPEWSFYDALLGSGQEGAYTG